MLDGRLYVSRIAKFAAVEEQSHSNTGSRVNSRHHGGDRQHLGVTVVMHDAAHAGLRNCVGGLSQTGSGFRKPVSRSSFFCCALIFLHDVLLYN